MGSLVISIDAELGWGFHDLADPPESRVESGRRGWRRLLALLDRFDVPATWAVVSHLMLDRCDGRHADHPAPPGWFERERGAWADRPDLRFAPDLVAGILAADPDHELAAHSFSHVLFGDPETTPEIAREEYERSREIAARWGLVVDSFVYPRNDVGHLDVLADCGFRAYRGRSPTPEGIRGVADAAIRDRSSLVHPRIDEFGLVSIPASLFAFGFEGRLRSIAESVWTDPIVARARRGIDRAATDDGVFHLWLHPNNLRATRDDDRMAAILEYAAEVRAESALEIETMGEVADRVGPSRTGDRNEATTRAERVI
ncbi:polysaccharide deacetylase family protein [Saliphagus sp. LR7]|uniref:polysaccharide deacetylase family protein n=1 Tax=Saliphagus sp. LR7 TaxID=2282654 RepID=UPI000DF79429|nr:polysaccharide deacetylase family protein [Saliphagus sp. LR7]